MSLPSLVPLLLLQTVELQMLYLGREKVLKGETEIPKEDRERRRQAEEE